MGWVIANYITLGIVIAYAVLLVFYLRAEATNIGEEDAGGKSFFKATALKLALSGIFCSVGLISFWILYNFSHVPDTFFIFKLVMIAGLFFAIAGDYYLQYIRRDIKKFKKGIGFFMVTQVLLIVPMCILNGIGWKELVITATVLLLTLLLMKKQNWQLGEAKKRLMAYSVLITFMAAKAFANMLADMTIGSVILAVGAALFLLSDILLGIWNYHSNKRLYANLNWICYFAGLMLIALSISPEFSTSLIY